MELRTFNTSLDSLGAHALLAPVRCKKITIREAPNPSTYITCWGVSNARRTSGPNPTQDTDPYTVYQGEAVTFTPTGPDDQFDIDETIGFMQAGTGTITLAWTCE